MRLYLLIDAIGTVIICIGVLLLIPIILAYIYQEPTALVAFAVAAFIGITLGLFLKKVTPQFKDLHRTEGIVIVAFTWLSAALLGAIPYLFFNLNPIDALFESMSGFTTTGATIFKDFSAYPKSLFFWRSFSQWIGGMGIIVLFIAVLPQFAVAGRSLFFAEAPGPTEDKLTPRIRHTAMTLWGLYISLTIIEIVLLIIFGMPVYDSICNSFSTIAAGGFSPHPESIMGYNNPHAEWIITIFIFIAGTNFALQFRALRSKNATLFFKNSEFITYASIFLVAATLLSILLIFTHEYDILSGIRKSAFQTVSILTGTGFACSDYELWVDSAKVILVALMFIGGCAGSSGCGMKVVRVLLLVKSAFRELFQVLHPKAIIPLKLDKQTVPRSIMRQISVFFVFYLLLVLISTIIISIIESSLIVGFTASAATVGNVGPGLGSVGPMGHYAHLNDISKIILTINMWVGRLEIMTVLILLSPLTWKYLSKK